jgi:hypothetical protein
MRSNAKADRPQSGGAVGGEGGWGSENDGGMKALWGPESSVGLDRRTVDDVGEESVQTSK